MDREHAIADLMEISSQVEAAVLLDTDGRALAASVPSERAERLAGAAAQLLEAASSRAGERELAQLEVATRAGSVFVVRDGGRTIAATTGPFPTAGLVLYDLRTCLRLLAESEPEAPKRKRSGAKRERAKEDTDARG